jgi:hypothetical protein
MADRSQKLRRSRDAKPGDLGGLNLIVMRVIRPLAGGLAR